MSDIVGIDLAAALARTEQQRRRTDHLNRWLDSARSLYHSPVTAYSPEGARLRVTSGKSSPFHQGGQGLTVKGKKKSTANKGTSDGKSVAWHERR